MPNSESSTSASLLARLQDGKPEAWERLCLLYLPLVHFWCRNLGIPEQDLPDVAQEVLDAVTKNIDKYRIQESGSFRGWLRTISRNKSVDWIRKHQHEPRAQGGTIALAGLMQIEQTEPAAEFPHENMVARQVYLRALQLIRGKFADKTWAAFWRVAVDGQKPNDVAEELDIKPATVRVAKSRVMHCLRLELGEFVDEPGE